MGIRLRFVPSSFANTEEPTAEDDEARFERRCVACGYGAVVRVAPEACPMCRATVQRYVQLVSISVTERRAQRPGHALATTGRHDWPPADAIPRGGGAPSTQHKRTENTVSRELGVAHKPRRRTKDVR